MFLLKGLCFLKFCITSAQYFILCSAWRSNQSVLEELSQLVYTSLSFSLAYYLYIQVVPFVIQPIVSFYNCASHFGKNPFIYTCFIAIKIFFSCGQNNEIGEKTCFMGYGIHKCPNPALDYPYTHTLIRPQIKYMYRQVGKKYLLLVVVHSRQIPKGQPVPASKLINKACHRTQTKFQFL